MPRSISKNYLCKPLFSLYILVDLFPEKLQNSEADPVAVAKDDVMFQPPIKRKIAQAPSAPSYKGNLYLSYILFA